MPENLLYRVTTDANARYVAQSGTLDAMGIFDVFTESPCFRKAEPFVRWLRDDIGCLDVFEWSVEMELDKKVVRKKDHEIVERLAHSLNSTHAYRMV